MALVCQAVEKHYRSYGGADTAKVFAGKIFSSPIQLREHKKAPMQRWGLFQLLKGLILPISNTYW